MKPLSVHVTAERLALGSVRDACGCPLALAVRAATGQRYSVGVFATKVVIRGKPFPLPSDLVKFVDLWDRDIIGERRRFASFSAVLMVDDELVPDEEPDLCLEAA